MTGISSHNGKKYSAKEITIRDIYDRQCNKQILGTTALYGPWTPDGEFDWPSYDNLVITALKTGHVPATNVDTTWAIYNDWDLTKRLIWRTAETAHNYSSFLTDDRPLMVAGINTNIYEDLSVNDIAGKVRMLLAEIDKGLRERGISDRVRYMPVPDKRLYDAASEQKIRVYREIGRVVSEFTGYGFVFFELDIGIPGFGSNFSPAEIEAILAETPQIQEYKSALISRKADFTCRYDFGDDLVRLKIVENVAPDRVQFSTGNDWFIALARYGKNLKKHGYLLGASQMSPALFKLWRDFVQAGKPCSLAIEQDLQAAAKDFWTPGNVGIYRHYLGIFLAMTGLITHPLPHPQCDPRYRVLPEDYFLPLKHAIRLGLVDPSDTKRLVRLFIPGCEQLTDNEINQRTDYLG
ncbi:hypothetical protein JXQ31_02575 [candidate division KSB1 bacterium]|nr:hypothetical protein [candidate division KSB1 bacterium]